MAQKSKSVPTVQIFGKNKCFDTRKAERWFKERRIPVQRVDLGQKAMSKGELTSVIRALGSIDAMVDDKHPDAALVKYLAGDDATLEKLMERPELLKTPIVRFGKLATVGACPEVWKSWLLG